MAPIHRLLYHQIEIVLKNDCNYENVTCVCFQAVTVILLARIRVYNSIEFFLRNWHEENFLIMYKFWGFFQRVNTYTIQTE